jgi:hypothetical protein
MRCELDGVAVSYLMKFELYKMLYNECILHFQIQYKNEERAEPKKIISCIALKMKMQWN